MRMWLGVSELEARKEVDGMNDPYARISWLRDVAEDHLAEGEVELAARAFILRLLGCTLFADKSARYVRMEYIGAVRHLDRVGDYAWGAIGLAFLYQQLGYASEYRDNTHLVGFATLLHVP
jgi:hypothetical protein